MEELESMHAKRSNFILAMKSSLLTQKYLSKEDVAFVHKALVYAVECHSGQYRKSGEPYIIHPIQVAGILAKLKLDAVTGCLWFFCMTW